MQFVLKIDCDNSAFTDDPHAEVADILVNTAKRLRMRFSAGVIHDSNGNSVGEFTFRTYNT